MPPNDSLNFELRPEGGKRFIWSTVLPALYGQLTALQVPDFCRSPDFPGRCDEGIRGVWDLWPIDETARRIYIVAISRLPGQRPG
jgi:hypothetical protein